MSLIERMVAPSGADEPHWVYLLRKTLDTWGIALGLRMLFAVSLMAGAHWANLIYVAIGQVKWWTTHPFSWWGTKGRGGLLGDVLYHGWIGAFPSIVLMALLHGRPAAWGAAVVWAFCWWVLENAGFGVVRPG
jgi:hypothetical protein